MKANETKVDKFLASNGTTFSIPVYQRNYDWSSPQCKQLINDILHAGKNDTIEAHFIGSIVYVHDDVYSASGVTELTIIDGQQRLTTMTLIYIALYRLAQRIGDKILESKIHKTYLINEFVQEAEKLKLKPTENNKEALNYILNAQDGEEFKKYSKIIENFKFFKNEINEDNYEAVLKGLSKLIFIDIALDRQRDNPQRIFESLNSTGLALSQADLIRNYILMGLKQNEQEKIYKGYWDVIEKNAKDETLNQTKVSDFIRDYLTLKNKEIPNKANVYTTFKKTYPTTTIDFLEENLTDLKSLSTFYNKLVNPKNENDKEIRRHLEFINRLEINVAYPFLMKVYEDFSTEKIDKNTFIQVLLLIQAYVFRRFIVGLQTNALNKIFMSLYDKIDQHDYLLSIQKTLLLFSGSQKFPRDTETINALKEKDVYSIKSKNRIYLFEQLENYQNNEPVVIDENPDITFEHIFPQNPDPTWKIDLGTEEYTFIKETYLNTIGNLTLSGNNGKLSNKSFAEKKYMNEEGKEQGYIFSRLRLNRDVKDKEKWGKAEIEERANNIAERFLEIWQIPNINIESVYSSDEVNIFDADDPTGKSIESATFFDQKIELKIDKKNSMADFYIIVIRKLFELHSEIFFETALGEKLKITTNESNYGNLQYANLTDTYFILTNTSSIDKFKNIKYALKKLGYEDQLTLKYAD
ncbi:MAG: DUF262 domain-containing protein [Treponemataceae bacterium]